MTVKAAAAALADETNPPYQLTRVTLESRQAIRSTRSFAEDVFRLSFSYLNSDGCSGNHDSEAAPTPQRADRATVRQVDLNLIGMSSRPDVGFVDTADSAESTVTVFERFPPASISACVTVWRQPYTHVSASCSFESAFVSPAESVGAAPHFGSETVIPVSVTLPVFVTVNVYGTTWPARRHRRRSSTT